MFIRSEDLVLTPFEDGGPDNPVVGYHNLVTTANLAADTEDPEYPASNLANPGTSSLWVSGMPAGVAAFFDGANDYLTRGAGLTGAANGKTFTVRGRIWKRGSNGTGQYVVTGLNALAGGSARGITVLADSSNRLQVQARNAAATVILNVSTPASSLLIASGWVDFVASFDLADAARRHVMLNGVIQTLTVDTYTDDTIDMTLSDWSVGGAGDGGSKFTGYVADIWLNPGYVDISDQVVAALYTEVFPHADPDEDEALLNDASVKVLLHMDGADASTSFPDVGGGAATTHVWTAAGNAQVDTAQVVFGTGSLLLDGTGDYISAPDHADFVLGSGDFTIDVFFHCNITGGSTRSIAGQADSAGTAAGTSFFIHRSSSNFMVCALSNGSSVVAITSTSEFTDALNPGFHHLAFVRIGNVIKMFLDGVQEGGDVAFSGTVPDVAETLVIGARDDVPTSPWVGWIDEFRLSVGVARWTANFTPPTAAYEAHGHDLRSRYLGAAGELPTGAAPILFLSGPTIGAWHTNKGTGGGLTLNGSLGSGVAFDYAEYVAMTLGGATVDYVGIAEHNLGTLGASVSVQGRATSSSDWAELVQAAVVADDGPLLLQWEAQSLYDVRIRIDAPESAGQAEAAVLYVGLSLTLQRRIYVPHVPVTMGRVTDVTNGRSESGKFLGRIITGESRETSVSQRNLTPGWVREFLDPFVVAAQEAPFFFAWRPETYPLEVGYCWLQSDSRPANQLPNGMMQVDLQMGAIA